MYNPTDLFRYGGLTALGLALAATGLPANAAVAPAPANRVSTYLQADTQFAGQPSREERRAERREARRHAEREGHHAGVVEDNELQ